MPAPALHRFEAVGPADLLEAAYARAVADPALALAASLFEHDGGRIRRLELIFDALPDRAALLDALGLFDLEVVTSVGPLAAQDWVALSLAGLAPVTAGRFRLRGSHDAPRAGGIDLLIEAGEAFGTGHHATTRGCLLALHDLLNRSSPRRRRSSSPPPPCGQGVGGGGPRSKRGPSASTRRKRPTFSAPPPLPLPRKGGGASHWPPPALSHERKRPSSPRGRTGGGHGRAAGVRALDLGTGTGALAIAVAKAARRPVLAADIDPIAVRVARDNVRINAAHGLVRVIEADGLRAPELRGRRFDLILANVHAGPLRAMAGDIVRACAPGGVIVLSGLLQPQGRSVLAAYRARGARLARAYLLDGWATLVLWRGPAR